MRIFVNGRLRHVLRGTRRRARIDLRGMPRSSYTVRVVVLTTRGEQITLQRRYRTCVAPAAKPAAGASRATGSVSRGVPPVLVCHLVTPPRT